jgi:hypothetical protein
LFPAPRSFQGCKKISSRRRIYSTKNGKEIHQLRVLQSSFGTPNTLHCIPQIPSHQSWESTKHQIQNDTLNNINISSCFLNTYAQSTYT